MKRINAVRTLGFGIMGSAIGLSAASSGVKVVFKGLSRKPVRMGFKEPILKPFS